MPIHHFHCCEREPEPKPCACGHEATLLCDFDVGDGKTCDEPICEACSSRAGDVLRLEADPFIRAAASVTGLRKSQGREPFLDFDGNPFPLSYDDTVDFCRKHSR